MYDEFMKERMMLRVLLRDLVRLKREWMQQAKQPDLWGTHEHSWTAGVAYGILQAIKIVRQRCVYRHDPKSEG